jgi:lysozyme family protein
MADFNLFAQPLVKAEGGFVNHPADPGGATKWGWTLRNWMAYGHDTDGDGDIDINDLKKLTSAQALPVFKKVFWDKLNLDKFRSQAIAENVCDHGINAGASRAAKMLQFILNYDYGFKQIKIDGVIGSHTLNAVNAISASKEKELMQKYTEFRAAYYAYRGNKTRNKSLDPFFTSLKVSPSKLAGDTFYKGWMNRLDYFKKKALV